MAPINVSFRKALTRLTAAWQSQIEEAVQRAQTDGQMDKSNDATKIALYVTANYGGARYLGKIYGRSSYLTFLEEFKKYLSNLN